MIRLLSSSLPLKTQISTATYLLNHQNKLRHPFRLQLPYFNFSNMKPNQPEPQPENNNDKNKNENNNNK